MPSRSIVAILTGNHVHTKELPDPAFQLYGEAKEKRKQTHSAKERISSNELHLRGSYLTAYR